MNDDRTSNELSSFIDNTSNELLIKNDNITSELMLDDNTPSELMLDDNTPSELMSDDNHYTYDIINPNMFGSGLHCIPDLDTYLHDKSLSRCPNIEKSKNDKNVINIGDIYWNNNKHTKAKVIDYKSQHYFDRNDWINGINRNN